MFALLASGAGGVDVTDPLNYLVGFGPLGVIVILFVIGQIHPKSHIENLMEQIRRKDQIIDQKDKLIQDLQAGIMKDALPALTRSTDALIAMGDTNDDIAEVLEAVKSRMDHVLDAILKVAAR